MADIVGEEGTVYAVEFSHRPGRDLINMAKKRTNVIPIIEDARHPLKYRMLVGMVDVVFADVAQPDQARIVGLNAHLFLKNEGHCVISIKANCIDSTAAPEAVFAKEVKRLKEEHFKPLEQITLEPYERDHAVVCALPCSSRVRAMAALREVLPVGWSHLARAHFSLLLSARTPFSPSPALFLFARPLPSRAQVIAQYRAVKKAK